MRIAIIDDNPVNLKLMESLVTRANSEYHPLTFQDSAVGLAWCLANEVDLLIVDYMMPAPDGLEVIRRYRERPGNADVPVLMITADHKRRPVTRRWSREPTISLPNRSTTPSSARACAT